MELLLERLTDDGDATLGVLFAEGRFCAFTCEDEHRARKLPGETRIPAGTYRIELRRAGGMIRRYRARYGAWHEGMLWLRDVPGFEWIYLHAGNTDDDTAGCILVGLGATAAPGAMSIRRSREAYAALARRVHAAIAAGGRVSIRIVDRDRAPLPAAQEVRRATFNPLGENRP